MNSSSFVARKFKEEERKARHMINFSQHSKNWPKATVKLETVQSFVVEMEREDMLMSWDFKSGYRHFYLHPLR